MLKKVLFLWLLPITLAVPPLAFFVKDRTPQQVAVSYQDWQCMAMNLFFEARGEGEAGMIAVGQVTLNRVGSTKFRRDVCSVVQEKHKGVCHFTWVCDRTIHKIKDKKMWQTSEAIAFKLLTDRQKDQTHAADHYHATYVKPYWASSCNRTAQIKNHVFYNCKHKRT